MLYFFIIIFFYFTITCNTNITYTTNTSYNTNIAYNTYITYNTNITYATTDITYNTTVTTYTTITNTINTTNTLPTQLIIQISVYIDYDYVILRKNDFQNISLLPKNRQMMKYFQVQINQLKNKQATLTLFDRQWRNFQFPTSGRR